MILTPETEHVTLCDMITRFRHKGLLLFFETGRVTGILPEHATRLRRILALLHTATTITDMDLPGLALHELKGTRAGTWTVRVDGNWRITFRMDAQGVTDVNYEDYH